jgi:Cys-tRNA(Pro)/Cys-tRNA(Cys) deacylase
LSASAAKKSGGKGTPATVAAGRAGIAFTLHPYDAAGGGESYGEAAADALGVSHDRLFKTLVAEVDGNLTVAVVPVSSTLDLKALAGASGGKRAAMADPAQAERVTGYVRGGISPLGQRKRLPTVVDSSASGFPTIYVSAGRRGLQVELAPADLIRLTGATTAGIARGRSSP